MLHFGNIGRKYIPRLLLLLLQLALLLSLNQQFLNMAYFDSSQIGMNGHLTTPQSDSWDSLANSASGADLDQDSDTLDSEKALNLAMDEESYENQAQALHAQLATTHHVTQVPGKGEMQKGIPGSIRGSLVAQSLAPTSKETSFAGSFSPPVSTGTPPMPITGHATLPMTANAISSNAVALAAAAGAGTLPINQLAQVSKRTERQSMAILAFECNIH